jgi:hypothetical protein
VLNEAGPAAKVEAYVGDGPIAEKDEVALPAVAPLVGRTPELAVGVAGSTGLTERGASAPASGVAAVAD